MGTTGGTNKKDRDRIKQLEESIKKVEAEGYMMEDKFMIEKNRLLSEISALNLEKDRLRTTYYQELHMNRNQHLQHLKSENRILKPEDRIYVERFDELHGLNPETLDIINQRLETVKTQCEFNLTKLRLANEKMHKQLSIKADPARISLEDQIKKMAREYPQFDKVLELLCQYYAESKVEQTCRLRFKLTQSVNQPSNQELIELQ